MIHTTQSEEVNSDEDTNLHNSGFIGTVSYLASLVMPFICYIWTTFFR